MACTLPTIAVAEMCLANGQLGELGVAPAGLELVVFPFGRRGGETRGTRVACACPIS